MPTKYVNGKLFLWGANNFGQLGDGTNTYRSSPVQVLGTLGWSYADAGGNHSLGIQIDGRLWAWGKNDSGQLGNDSAIDRNIPTIVVGSIVNSNQRWDLSKAGENFSIASKIDGTLWSWGNNTFGQLGDGTFLHRSSPVQISNFGQRLKSISAGKTHAAVVVNNIIYTWGTNGYGELAQNNDDPYNVPVAVPPENFYAWNEVSCGTSYTVALRNDGSVWGWGRNADGELGDEVRISVSSPVQILFPVGYWSAVSAGEAFTGAINNKGYVRTTATPTPTTTASPSPSPTPTNTPTPTADSKTPTPSRSPTPTPSASATSTPTPTATTTPTPTPTATGDIYVLWVNWV